MVQDAVLLETTQHEIRETVKSRKRKLQQLYRVTCATATAFTPRSVDDNHPHATKGVYTESDFLDANDLLKGRVFDVTTLRRLPQAEPLFGPGGEYLGPPQQYLDSLTTSPPAKRPRLSSASQKRSDNVSSPPRQHSATLGPNGYGNGSQPRSPVSPVDEADKENAVSTRNMKVMGEASNRHEHIKSITPATPPADSTARPPDSQASQEATARPASNASNANGLRTTESSSISGPENQLLQEAAVTRSENVSAKPTEPVSEKPPLDNKPSNSISAPPARTPKPPMRIDTSITSNNRSAYAVPASAATPAATPMSTAVGQASPPERMRTRVSTGTIRHKSVSEILGETPRTAAHDRTPSMDKTAFSPADSMAPSRRFSQASGTPDTATFKRRLSDIRGKTQDLSHQSMVVFARNQGHEDKSAREVVSKRGALQGVDDYLLPLFLAQASGHSTGLANLLSSSRKALTTANHHLEARELRDCRILKRIYTLQSTNKWSLRQPARAIEPSRPASHWDALLSEARWMRTDFREERKWKHALARTLADACAEWVASTDEERKTLQIKTKKPTSKHVATNGMTPDSTPNGQSQDDVPELVSSHEDDTSEEADEDLQLAFSAPLPPAAVFSLGPDDLTFSMGQTGISEKLLSELPMFDPLKDLGDRADAIDNRSLDESWRKPLTIVSRYNDGKIVFPENYQSKRRKASRYDYEEIHDAEETHTSLVPEQLDVAMFRPENRHIIQRLHASHAFRLPQPPIPSQEFFIHRQGSQWTRQEEDALRRLVREYAFNWALISSMLTSSSIYSSGPERRTPWECFERWETLEGMPNEYARHEFYKRWHLRRQTAKQRNEEQYRQAQEQAPSQQIQRLSRRNIEPQTVDRRRGDKHIYVFQAMAKLAKKRETQQQKQQHMAAVAATRKGATDTQQTNNKRMKTPAEFSSHKHKQEQEIRLKIVEHRQQMARQAAANSARTAVGPQGMPAVAGLGRGSLPSNVATTQAAAAAAAGMARGQAGLLPPGQGMMNGALPNGTRGPAMVQGQIPYQQGQTSNASNARMLAEASRVSEQQRLMQQTRQYPAANGTGQNVGAAASQQAAGSFQGLQQQGGKLSPAVNGQRPLSSPRPNATTPGNQQLSSGITPAINHIKSSIKSLHPTYTDQQVNQMATQQLNAQLHSQNRTGNPTNGYPAQGQANAQASQSGQAQGNGLHPMSGGMPMMTGQQYAQALHQQMTRQSGGQLAPRSGSSGAHGTPRPDSRGLVASAQQNRASTATPGPAAAANSQSPRPTSAQVAKKT